SSLYSEGEQSVRERTSLFRLQSRVSERVTSFRTQLFPRNQAEAMKIYSSLFLGVLLTQLYYSSAAQTQDAISSMDAPRNRGNYPVKVGSHKGSEDSVTGGKSRKGLAEERASAGDDADGRLLEDQARVQNAAEKSPGILDEERAAAEDAAARSPEKPDEERAAAAEDAAARSPSREEQVAGDENDFKKPPPEKDEETSA
ncbi:hypothetical protein BOX15_Mlig030010g2, partial [Macrostomum lignano]